MTVQVVVAISLIAALGFFVVRLLHQTSSKRGVDLSIDVCLGLLIGVGLSSESLFLIGLFFDGLGFIAMGTEAAFLIVLLCVALYFHQRGRSQQPESRQSDNESRRAEALQASRKEATTIKRWPCFTESKLVNGIRILLCLTILAGAWVAIAEQIRVGNAYPEGNWDAWAIWNARAKFLYLASENWTNVFTPGTHVVHPDYPLLLPLNIARLLCYSEQISSRIPYLIGCFSSYLCVVMLALGVARFRGVTLGLFAAALMLSAKLFMSSAAWQFADFPLTTYLLAAVISLARSLSEETHGWRTFIPAGLLCGFAAWTKNEGQLIVLATGLSLLCVTCFKGSAIQAFYSGRSYAIGVIIAVIALVIFKIGYAPENDIFANQTLHEISKRFVTPERWALIGTHLASAVWTIYGHVVVAILAYIVMTGFRKHERRATSGAIATGLTIGLVCVGYVTIYAITPQPLEWHLITSANRLLTHLAPATIFAVCLFVSSPEELLLPVQPASNVDSQESV